MMKEHLKADGIKAAVGAYYRYLQQDPMVAFEANCLLGSFNNGGQADIYIVTQERRLLEVEVKMTMVDFRSDRRKAKHKHFRAMDNRYPASRFYFAVPRNLANEVCLACDQLYPYAGVLGVDRVSEFGVFLYRNAKDLGGTKLTLPQLFRMAREQSATLCRLALKDARKNDSSYGEE